MNTSRFLIVALLCSNIVAMERPNDNGAGLGLDKAVSAVQTVAVPAVESQVAAATAQKAVSSTVAQNVEAKVSDCTVRQCRCSEKNIVVGSEKNILADKANHAWEKTKDLVSTAKNYTLAQKNTIASYVASVKTRGWNGLDKNEKLAFAAAGTVVVASVLYVGYKLYKACTKKQQKTPVKIRKI